MSEERLSAELDGKGGGLGKFKGLTVRELSALFEAELSEPTMLSFSAVLRITREQIEARGALTAYPLMTGICAVCAVIAGIVWLVSSDHGKQLAIRGLIGSGLACLAFGAGWMTNRKQTKASIAQEKAIRKLAIESLIKIAENPKFKPKELNDDQHRILRDLLKKTKTKNAALSALLQP